MWKIKATFFLILTATLSLGVFRLLLNWSWSHIINVLLIGMAFILVGVVIYFVAHKENA
jgi:hypothetical protein